MDTENKQEQTLDRTDVVAFDHLKIEDDATGEVLVNKRG